MILGELMSTFVFCTQISLFTKRVDFHLSSLFSALSLTPVWCYHIQNLSGSIFLKNKPLVSFGREGRGLAAQGRGLRPVGPIAQ